jgi:hypothetical protein
VQDDNLDGTTVGDAQREEVERLLRTADKLYEDGAVGPAVRLYRKVLTLQPDHEQAASLRQLVQDGERLTSDADQLETTAKQVETARALDERQTARGVLRLQAFKYIKFAALTLVLTIGGILGGSIIGIFVNDANNLLRDRTRDDLDSKSLRPAAIADSSVVVAQKRAEAAAEQRAIELAKNGRNLLQPLLFGRNIDPATLTNDHQIRAEMSNLKGDIDVIGWQARRIDSDTFLVTYVYALRNDPGGFRGWPFEVNVPHEIVRRVLGDRELEQKYGWTLAR